MRVLIDIILWLSLCPQAWNTGLVTAASLPQSNTKKRPAGFFGPRSLRLFSLASSGGFSPVQPSSGPETFRFGLSRTLFFSAPLTSCISLPCTLLGPTIIITEPHRFQRQTSECDLFLALEPAEYAIQISSHAFIIAQNNFCPYPKLFRQNLR